MRIEFHPEPEVSGRLVRVKDTRTASFRALNMTKPGLFSDTCTQRH